MDKIFEKKYHEYEKKHFWFIARRKFILQLLNSLPIDSTILDIGCSSGIFIKDLIKAGFDKNRIYGIDISEEAIHKAQADGLQNVFIMDAQHIALEKKFDIIISSDCLEHLADEEKALKCWRGLLKDHGILYVFVPAFQFLWSHHDELNMHYRRYTKNELSGKLAANGFDIVKSGYWNFILFFPIAVVRLFSKFSNKENSIVSLNNKLSIFNKLFYFILFTENKLLKVISYPIGISCFCIVKKSTK
ncbi:class I SAM-dependent methyltransferase [Aquimarina agarivorans]|uniref:class I SAM-dependent methyltransferase n=1 Tax=Aquimarina agarivorans TaxID=980584 RepID=UPI000248E984|nr:class I SAM-dependent methyltransferase [Aquimarina agarivorans]